MSVLILTQPGNQVNTYGPYVAEVLKADGFADLRVAPLSEESLGQLDTVDAVILTAALPVRVWVAALTEYVKGGGRLIALRPSRLLATALGLVPTDTVAYPAYLLPRADHPISAGVPHESIQTHVPTDQYEVRALPDGAQEVARLYAEAETPTSFPGVLHFSLGQGQVVIFTYDLPRAVALIRQGNPLLAGGRTVGYGRAYRPNEFFVGHVDPRRVHLPQADIHGMLLGNAINAIARAPQARWWYYPTPETKSVVVLDSDDDWSAPEHFDALIEAAERHGGHVTIYLMLGPTRYTIATPEKVAAWRERGHSFGIHHNAYDPVYKDEEQDATMEAIVRRDVAYFREHYGGVPLANRNHSLVWKGYVDLPRLYAELGVGMEFNTLSLFQYWLTYLNGSGRPARFVDTNGEIIDVFQQLTQAYDDASVKQKLSADPLAEAARTRQIMEEKVRRYFSPLSMLSHPVSFFTYSSAYMNACWEHARELGMPIWSAFEWAAFVRARDRARISHGRWEDGRFTCAVAGQSPRLTLMVPIERTRGPVAGERKEGWRASATVDGQPVAVTRQEAFGWEYALVPVKMAAEREQEHEVVVEL